MCTFGFPGRFSGGSPVISILYLRKHHRGKTQWFAAQLNNTQLYTIKWRNQDHRQTLSELKAIKPIRESSFSRLKFAHRTHLYGPLRVSHRPPNRTRRNKTRRHPWLRSRVRAKSGKMSRFCPYYLFRECDI